MENPFLTDSKGSTAGGELSKERFNWPRIDVVTPTQTMANPWEGSLSPCPKRN